MLAANNNQSTKIRIQGKSSGGTEHNWNLAVPRSADRFGIDNGVTTHFTSFRFWKRRYRNWHR